MNDKECRKLAAEIFDGVVITSLQVDKDLIPNVFMPLLFGAFKDTPKEELDKIHFLWGYIKDSFPRGINGYPMLHSFYYCNKEDGEKVLEYHDALVKQRKEMLGEDCETRKKEENPVSTGIPEATLLDEEAGD